MNRFRTCPNMVKHPISRGQNVGKIEIPKHIITNITILGSIMQQPQWLHSPSSLVISVLSVHWISMPWVLFIMQKRNHETFENWMPYTYINSIEPTIPPRTSRSPSVSQGMSNAESCALDANGILMDVSKIIWYNESRSWWWTATVSLIDASQHTSGCHIKRLWLEGKGTSPHHCQKAYHQSDIQGPKILDRVFLMDHYQYEIFVSVSGLIWPIFPPMVNGKSVKGNDWSTDKSSSGKGEVFHA